MEQQQQQQLSIRQRYQLNKARKNMLQFMVQVKRQNSRYRYVMNADSNGCHLNNCFSSSSTNDNNNNCHCRRLERFGHVPKIILDCKILSFHPWGPPVQQPVSQTSDEPFPLFFQRLQDPIHLIQWYEDYRLKSQALYFQGIVRDRKMPIDVQYHPFLKEWHLTICERWTEQMMSDFSPDTCECWNAIDNPHEYLENHYHILDEQWIQNIYPTKKPIQYYQQFMQDYQHRIDSFPTTTTTTQREKLAEAGFFWCGDSILQCAFCSIQVQEEHDNVLRLHIQLNPKCPLLTKPWDLPFFMKHRRTFPDSKFLMQDYSQRLASFEKNQWTVVDPQTLARAGFFHVQKKDAVQCPFCEIVLNNWKKGDDPFQDHVKFNPHCPYLRNFQPPPHENTKNHHTNTKTNFITKDPKRRLVCKICLDRELNITFQPCGHCVTCSVCSETIFDCPICRKPIYHKINTYIS